MAAFSGSEPGGSSRSDESDGRSAGEGENFHYDNSTEDGNHEMLITVAEELLDNSSRDMQDASFFREIERTDNTGRGDNKNAADPAVVYECGLTPVKFNFRLRFRKFPLHNPTYGSKG